MKFGDIWFEMYIINYLPMVTLMHILNMTAPLDQQAPTIAITILGIIFALAMAFCEYTAIRYFKMR